MSRDPEMHESIASLQVLENDSEPHDEERKLNGGLGRGDADTNLSPGLNAGRSETIPFFPSFFDNLGPRYQPSSFFDNFGPTYQPPPNSEDVLLETNPSGGGQALHNIDSDNHTSDSFEFKSEGGHGITATLLPKARKVEALIRTDDPDHDTPDSSLLVVQDWMLEGFESENEVTSTCKALVRTTFASAGCTPSFSFSSERAICGSRICDDANRHDRGFQRQRCPVCSAGSSLFGPRTYIQCSRKPATRDLHVKEKELEDYRSPQLTPKRLRLEVGFGQDCTFIAPGVVPLWCHDFDQSIHVMQAARCIVSAERCRRLRLLMSPARVPVSSLQRAMDRTLLKLQHWHCRLHLDNPACPIVASHIFWRAFRLFHGSRLRPEADCQFRVRVLMATAFWVAAKIVDTMRKIPKASDMASTAGITSKCLIHAELPMLDALKWTLVRY